MGTRNDLYGSIPGIEAARETYENEFRFGAAYNGLIVGVNVSGAARDSTNTPTTRLRQGLLLGRITSSGLYTNYSPTATDGSQVVAAILIPALAMVNLDGDNVDRFAWALAAGPVQASKLINLDYVARAQMRGRFIFDDDFGNKQGYVGYQREVAKTADYTVVAADAGTLFTTTAAAGTVIFTLPTIAAGLGPFEFLNVVDQTMTIASAGSLDNIVTDGDAAADSISFATASHKIGGRVRLVANAAGTKWYMENLSPPGCVITVA